MSIKSKIQALIAAANAKTGESDATLTDAVQTLVDGFGQGGGDPSLLNSLIDGTITSINYSGSTIRNYAFHQCRQLETISAPDVTSFGDNAFSGCDKLKNLFFPKALSIGNEAFRYDSEIEEVTTTNFPLITSIYTAAFLSCTKLTRVLSPNASVGLRAFSGCSSLKTAVFKSFSYYSNFEGCAALEAADKTGGGNVVAAAFNNCGALTTLVLRSSTLCALSNTNAFSGTPFASGGTGGTLYVPQALVSQYTQATNWSTILGYANNQILPIEGSIYESQYADGTPVA